jgi:hypothetical protein
MRSAPALQNVTQMEQALHRSLSTTGLGHSFFLTAAQGLPPASVMAPAGHIRPQTPHSTQRFPLMTCRVFRSPEMAKTGHEREQAVQPIHFSVIVYAILKTTSSFVEFL